MSTNTPDQQITLPVGTDLADNPQAFTDMIADVETRLVLKYTNVADRTARHTAPAEGDLTGLNSENRYDVFDGSNYVSLAARIDHVFVRRSTDGTPVNASTVLVNDPVLVAAVDSGGTYMWEAWIVYDSSTTADIKFAFTTPTFSSMRWSGMGLANTATTSTGDVKITTVSVSGTSADWGGIGVGTITMAKIEGFIVTTAAGNIQFQFAQQVSDATNTTIRNGSYLRVRRVA